MDQGFSYGDLIVLGAIAAFILLRYRAMLGSKSEGEDAPRSKPAPLSEYERVIQLPAARIAPPAAKKEDFTGTYGSFAETFVAMRGIDREFSPDEFLTGARAAYEMVIEAFSKGDRETLKMLLAPAVYKHFDATLNENQSAGRVLSTTLVAISKAEIADVALKSSYATITVDFVSLQIHLVRDTSGAIIEGNVSQQDQVEDRWVFTRNLNSQDPSWSVVDT